MKNISIIIVLAILATVNLTLAAEPLANENKKGLYARSIEEVLRLDAGEVDLGTAALIISERWSGLVQGRKYQSQLDDMAYDIRERLKTQKLSINNYKAIEVINKYLFEEAGFKTVKDANDANDLFLHTVLDKKHGYCLSLSVMYLAIAERLGLPLYGVVVPGHFFVRYDDGQVRFNIEPTSKGGFLDDDHYIRQFKVPTGNSIYMKNLNKVQTIGCFFNNLGNIYNESGDTNSAMTVLEKAVEINPLLADSRMNLGIIYLKKDRIDDAVRQFRFAMEINPNDAAIRSNLGYAFIRQDRYNDAVAQFNEALGLNPKSADTYKKLAFAYSKLGLFSSAKAAVRDAIVLNSNDADCYKLLGDLYSEEGENYREAIFQYKKAIDYKKDLAEAYYGMGMCYNKLGRIDDEINSYKKALEYRSNMAPAMQSLANAYMGQKNYDAAIELYKKAIAVQPSDNFAHYNLGVAYMRKNDFEQAAEQYLKTIELSPRMAEAHNGAAIAFYNLKKYDLAMQHIKKAEQLGTKINHELLDAIGRQMK